MTAHVRGDNSTPPGWKVFSRVAGDPANIQRIRQTVASPRDTVGWTLPLKCFRCIPGVRSYDNGGYIASGARGCNAQQPLDQEVTRGNICTRPQSRSAIRTIKIGRHETTRLATANGEYEENSEIRLIPERKSEPPMIFARRQWKLISQLSDVITACTIRSFLNGSTFLNLLVTVPVRIKEIYFIRNFYAYKFQQLLA